MKIPILKIKQFQESEPVNEFYVNTFSNHIALNKSLINRPHKHNFYLCVVFTEGSGTHEVDFNSYKISPGKVFFLRPGQTHFWTFDTPPEGYILFHSQEFYELYFLEHKLNSFPFFSSFLNSPVLEVSQTKTHTLSAQFHDIYEEYVQDNTFRTLKMVSLLNIIYINLTREYTTNIEVEEHFSSNYLMLFEKLEVLINKHFQVEKFPKFYANQLHITTKHLNRVVKGTINKTTSDLISERIILEAKRLIVHSDDSLTTIANKLDFSDYSYFSKLFKAKTTLTPMQFRKKYIQK